MAIEVMTLQAREKHARPEGDADEIAKRLSVWLSERPGARIINIETILVRDQYFSSPYDGERVQQHFRIWLDVPTPSGS